MRLFISILVLSVMVNSHAAVDTNAMQVSGAAAITGTVVLSVSLGVPPTNNPGSLIWAQAQSTAQADYGFSTSVDSSGNVFMCGMKGIGPSIYLAKYSSAGTLLWLLTFPASGSAYGVTVDGSGNVYITGAYFGSSSFGGSTFPGDAGVASMFVAKFSPAGAHIWSKGYPTVAGPNMGWGIAMDGGGNIVLTGLAASINFGGGVLTGSGNGSLVVANLSSADGSYIWARQYGTGYASGKAIKTDGSGNLLVTGYFFQNLPIDATTLTSSAYGGFVVKLTNLGSNVWAKGFGAFPNNPSSLGHGGNSVAVAPNGDSFITGAFVGSIDLGGGVLTAGPSSNFDIFFGRFSSAGTHQWSMRVTSTAISTGVGYGAATDSSGNMIFTGKVFGTADFGGVTASTLGLSTFVAKYSPAGSCSWAKVYSGNNFGSGISTDSSGNPIITGSWSGNITFGGPVMPSQGGGNDAYLVKLSP